MDKIIKKRTYFLTGVFTLLILLVPGFGMAFSDEVVWKASDFIVMGVLVFSAIILNVFLLNTLRGWRLVLSSALVLLGFLYVWAELAVGIVFDLGS